MEEEGEILFGRLGQETKKESIIDEIKSTLSYAKLKVE